MVPFWLNILSAGWAIEHLVSFLKSAVPGWDQGYQLSLESVFTITASCSLCQFFGQSYNSGTHKIPELYDCPMKVSRDRNVAKYNEV